MLFLATYGPSITWDGKVLVKEEFKVEFKNIKTSLGVEFVYPPTTNGY
jgi:hypothetical protein